MDRKAFGKLIAALREEHLDFSSKGMGVWTQSKLAQEANLPEKTISQIEQGRKMNFDAQTMTQLAHALKLGLREQLALFAASSEVGIDPKNLGHLEASQAFQMFSNLIEGIRLPAFISDQYTNVLLSNSIALEVLDVSETMINTAPQTVSGFNLLRVVFATESTFRKLMGEQWNILAESSLRFFRAATLRYRHTDRFRTILAELSDLPDFREFWFNTQKYGEDLTPSWMPYAYRHPTLGYLSFIAHVSKTQTDQGSLYLTTYLPCTRETTQIFEDLMQKHGVQLQHFVKWPYPQP